MGVPVLLASLRIEWQERVAGNSMLQKTSLLIRLWVRVRWHGSFLCICLHEGTPHMEIPHYLLIAINPSRAVDVGAWQFLLHENLIII